MTSVHWTQYLEVNFLHFNTEHRRVMLALSRYHAVFLRGSISCPFRFSVMVTTLSLYSLKETLIFFLTESNLASLEIRVLALALPFLSTSSWACKSSSSSSPLSPCSTTSFCDAEAAKFIFKIN